MNQGVRRKIGFAAAAGLVVLVLAGLLGGADFLLDSLAKVVDLGERGVGGKLRRAGVLAYWDFDDVRPRERVGRTAVVTGGTRLVAGRNGSARSFLPKEHGLIRTAVPLSALGARFSFSCWLRFPEAIPDQQIFQYLAVKDGKLVLQLPARKFSPGPPRSGGASSTSRSRSTLPTSGLVCTSTGSRWASSRCGRCGTAAGSLFRAGQVYAAAVFRAGRGLGLGPPPRTGGGPAAEPAALAARRRQSLPRVIALRLAQAARDSYRAFLLAADLFNPSLHESRIFAARLPSYALALSRNDVKHFTRYFNEREENGLNAPGSSKSRRVEFLEGGRMRSAAMELVAADSGGPRRIAEVDVHAGAALRRRRTRAQGLLRPIEGLPYLLEMLAGNLARECGLPAAAPELCTVSVNGTFEGLHLCSEVGRDHGPLRLSAPGALQALLQRAPVFRDEVLREFDRLASALERRCCSDRKSPLTSREIMHGIRSQRRLLEAALPDRTTRSDEALVARVAGHLREDLFLGDNPHATLVVGDLDLSTRRINGADLAFESLTPTVLGSDGRVAPPGARPLPPGFG